MPFEKTSGSEIYCDSLPDSPSVAMRSSTRVINEIGSWLFGSLDTPAPDSHQTPVALFPTGPEGALSCQSCLCFLHLPTLDTLITQRSLALLRALVAFDFGSRDQEASPTGQLLSHYRPKKRAVFGTPKQQ
jgi:hypothetical protein